MTVDNARLCKKWRIHAGGAGTRLKGTDTTALSALAQSVKFKQTEKFMRLAVIVVITMKMGI